MAERNVLLKNVKHPFLVVSKEVTCIQRCYFFQQLKIIPNQYYACYKSALGPLLINWKQVLFYYVFHLYALG